MKKQYFLIIVSLCFSLNLSAGKLKKGFEALDIYNYFAAKKYFEKSLKKDLVAASFGLSSIYLRNDNPFYDLELAYVNIVASTNGYSNVAPKKKVFYTTLGADSLSIFRQRDKVSNALYQSAKQNHNVISYQRFIDRNAWSKHIDSVIYFRDNLAFEEVQAKNTSVAFKAFVVKYPNSYLKEDAVAAYELLNYQEKTVSNNFIDYVTFVKNFPESPYKANAEDEIYKIYTKTGSMDAYENFIKQYPENRNVPQAWKKMFNTYLQTEYSASSIQAFLNEFKDYPYKEELKAQLARVEKRLYPIKERGKWGYINADKDIYVKPIYESAEPFYEGLAIVQLEGKYGFVDKTGGLVIDAIFDDAYKMNEGHAVVEIDEQWGLINRSGEFVIQPAYEDLGNLTEGLAYYSEGGLYGYFDNKGIVRLKPQYSDAEDMANGKAIVSNQGNYGVIDVFGTTTIPFKYERLVYYSDSTYAAKFRGLWGLLNVNGDTLMGFKYDFIGKMYDNRAMVVLDDAFNYIDPLGNEILGEWIEDYPEFRQLAVFTNGFAKIEYEDGYNLIDTNGRSVFRANKADLGSYSSLIAIKRGDNWGFVNKNGSLVIPYKFSMANSFEGKYAKAGGAPLVGIINKTGNYQIEPYFERLSFFNDSVIIAKSRGDYGLLLTNGDTLLNIAYVSIEPYTATVVVLETTEAIFYYDLTSNKFIRKED